MDDLWFYVMNFLELDDIVIMSYVSNYMFTITRKLDLKPCDLLYLSLSKNHFNISKFLIEKQYDISINSINLTIFLGNFELLNRMNYIDKLDNNMIIPAIKSNNIKMIKFIKNKLGKNYICNQYILINVLRTDNIEIYKLLVGGSINYNKVVMLVDHNCFNIIESYRFNDKRESFETIIFRHAIFTNNQSMIDHCIENGYDNQQTRLLKLSEYL